MMPWSLCQHSTCVTNTPTHLYGHIYLKRSSLRYFSLYYKSKLQSGEQCSHPNPAIKPQCTKQPNTNEDQTFSSALGYIHTVLKAQLQQHQLVSAKKKKSPWCKVNHFKDSVCDPQTHPVVTAYLMWLLVV